MLLTACKNQVEISTIEQREHGLSYLKGTNKLVNGEVIRKFEDGKIAELNTYKDGKPIGKWFAYGYQREIISHGFGVDADKYASLFPNLDFAYSFLSINIEGPYAFATLYLDSQKNFEDFKLIYELAKEIFSEYSAEYKIEDLLIYNDFYECKIAKKAIVSAP